MGECFECVDRRLRLEEKLRRLRTEKECYEIAKEIYTFLEQHPSSALHGKRITITLKKKEFEQ